MEITLSKSGKKKFLFFDEWIVGNNFDIAKDYKISVPDGSQVLIDGIDVTKNTEKTDGRDSFIVYQIDKIFSGNHVIEFKNSIFQNTKEIVGIYTNDDEEYVYTPDMKLSEEAVKDITDDSINYMKQYLYYAINRKSASELSEIIKNNYFEGFKNSYDSFCERITLGYYDYEYEYAYPSIANISNISTNFYTKDASEEEDEYEEDDTDDTDYNNLGYVEINAYVNFKYPSSDIEDYNVQLTQKYHYGLSDGDIIVTYVENEFNSNNDY